MNNKICPRCGGPLIQKNKTKLFLVGVAFLIIGGGLAFLSYKLWLLTFLLCLISIYLIAWSSLGKGLWCRQCKSAPFKKL